MSLLHRGYVNGLYSYYMPNTPLHLNNIKTIKSRMQQSLPIAIPDDTMDYFDDLTAYYLNNQYPDSNVNWKKTYSICCFLENNPS